MRTHWVLELLYPYNNTLSTTSYSCWTNCVITLPSILILLVTPVFCAGVYQEHFGFLQSFLGFFSLFPLFCFFAFFPCIRSFGSGDLFFFFPFFSRIFIKWDLNAFSTVLALSGFRNSASMFQLQLSPGECALLAELETAWVVKPREQWWMELHPAGSWLQVVVRDWQKLLLAQHNWNGSSNKGKNLNSFLWADFKLP